MNAASYHLEELVGKMVRSLVNFSGIPAGTVGLVDEHYKLWDGHEGVMVKWTTTQGTVVRDGFGRDSDGSDETSFLEVV